MPRLRVGYLHQAYLCAYFAYIHQQKIFPILYNRALNIFHINLNIYQILNIYIYMFNMTRLPA